MLDICTIEYSVIKKNGNNENCMSMDVFRTDHIEWVNLDAERQLTHVISHWRLQPPDHQSEYTAWSYYRHQENKTEMKTIFGIGQMCRIKREIEVLNWSTQESGKGQLLR